MIGLSQGTVKLVAHNPEWTELFEKEKQLLKKTFGDTIVAVEHIGSTAIPGIEAKPILDMGIGVRSLKIAREMRKKFEKLGYEYRSFGPGQTRGDLKNQELYVKGLEEKRTHHAHVAVFGSERWNNDLFFRDYLRSHPKRAKQYAELKKKLAVRHANDRRKYMKSKVEFISETVRRARKALGRNF